MAKPSKLAKEHNITAAEELEIREVFELFEETRKGEKEKVIPIGDVRRAMKCVPFRVDALPGANAGSRRALGIAPGPDELEEFISILDPDEEGFAVYSSFVAICALKFHTRTRTSDSHAKEVDEAFALFTSSSGEGRITLATLKRVARTLKEDVDEELMRRMISEANGGAGVTKGVEKDEFEAIMRRAGVWR